MVSVEVEVSMFVVVYFKLFELWLVPWCDALLCYHRITIINNIKRLTIQPKEIENSSFNDNYLSYLYAPCKCQKISFHMYNYYKR
jgi:hypothetical protein